MKLLILTQYFPPEVGAPQNRLYELALRLQAKGADITVLTAMPNYPAMEIHEEYKGKWYSKEEMSGMQVHRSWIYVSKSKGIFKRLLNYFSFVFSSLFIGTFKLGKYDYVLCESPPLFLGVTAVWLKWIKRSKLIFNVSDLWPESAEKLGLVTNKLFLNIATVLEEFLYKQSAYITGQTQGIVKNISTRFPNKKVYWLPNGVDLSYYNPSEIESNWRQQNGFSEMDFILLYGGIIGHAQGLEVILKAAEILKEKNNIKFVLLGEGPEKTKLLKMKEELGLSNVIFKSAVPKTEMPNLVKGVDMALVPLRKLDLFKGAIPSKMFESLAMEKPIMLGVDGEARDLFVKEGKCAVYFEPENYEELATRVDEVVSGKINLEELKLNCRKYMFAKFDRNKIATDFWNYLHA